MTERTRFVRSSVPLSERTAKERALLDRTLYGRSRTGPLPKYDPDYHPASLIEFFRGRLDEVKDAGKFESRNRREYVTRPVRPPTLARWCVEQGVTQPTAWLWAEKYPEFDEAVQRCRDILEAFAVELTAINGLNQPFVKQLMQNYFGWSDKGEMSHRGGVGVTITIDEQDAEA